MAYFTTSATIDAEFLEGMYQFSGTGPFWVAEEHLLQIYSQLTASGATVTRWNVHEVVLSEQAAGITNDVVMNPETQIVIDAVYFIPSAAIVGATDNYHVFKLGAVNGTAGTTGTIASYSATSGTWGAWAENALTASTVASVATVPAGYLVTFQMSTTGTGLAHSGGLLQIRYHTV